MAKNNAAEDTCFSEDEGLAQTAQRRNTVRFKLQRWHASCESFLSSNGFIVLFLSTYAISVVLMFFWGAREEYMYTETPVKRWFIAIARGWGYTLNLNCALVVLLASRLCFTVLRETPLNLVLPFDKCFPQFHMIVAYVILVAVCGHGIFHMVWIIGWKQWKGGLWGINMCVCTGFALASVLIVMVVTSQAGFRQAHFERFYFIHNIGAVVFFSLLFVHGVYNGTPYTYKWIVAPLALYIADRIVRRAKMAHTELEISGEEAVLKGGDVVRVAIPKQFEYRAGQYAEIKIKSISKLEWHPFTIASAPFEESMTFYIKAVGDWTAQLKQTFETRAKGFLSELIHAHIRGPYGAPAQHVGGYQRVVLISGGVGATPFCSICKDLYNKLTSACELEATAGEPENSLDELSDVNKEVMAGVQRAFEDGLHLHDEQLDPYNEEEVFSLPDLFVASNHLKIDEALLTKRSIHSKTKSRAFANMLAMESGRSTNQIRKTERNEAKLTRMGLSYNVATPRNALAEEEAQRDEWNLEKGSQCMDNVEAYWAVRNAIRRSQRQRALHFFYAVGINLATYMILLLRLFVAGMASIFGSMGSLSKSSSLFQTKWVIIVDTVLAFIVIGIVGASLCTEFAAFGTSFFKSKGKVVDLFVLVPLLCLSVVCGMSELTSSGEQRTVFLSALVHFAVIIPLAMLFLALRLYRIVGSRVLLADFSRNNNYQNMKAIDFIWTVPHSHEDAWLREELGHLANRKHLRLHRYVTRDKQCNEGLEPGFPGMSTSYGRPDWEEIFRTICERTPSNGKVGVFFCGPRGMSRAVREALMKAQVVSNLRGVYLGASAELVGGSAADKAEKERLQQRGSNIRFVFREEMFG